MESLLSSTCDLFTRIFEVFNEMEISVINNFHKILSKNKSKRKRNFIYHFPVKSKPRERIDLLIITRVNIYQTKQHIFLKENG